MLDHLHPSYQYNIPYPSYMNIGKLGSSGDLTSYTCDGLSKMCHLILDQVHGAA